MTRTAAAALRCAPKMQPTTAAVFPARPQGGDVPPFALDEAAAQTPRVIRVMLMGGLLGRDLSAAHPANHAAAAS